MKNSILILIALFTVFTINGCASLYNKQKSINIFEGWVIEWQEKIKEEGWAKTPTNIKWQKRIKKEGWSKNLVDEIVDEYLSHCILEYPRYTSWPTPKEFKDSGYKGNCIARASGLFGLLKQLKCPYPIGIEAVASLLTRHALLVVQYKTGVWTRYETIYLF